MSASSPSIRPQTGESYRQFVPRAHAELMQRVPDPDERNQVVWDAWADAYGDPLADRAQEYFSEDKYRTVPNVCYFLEHSTKGNDGNPVRYSVSELADIIDEHNDRADTNNYTAIVDRHTHKGLVPKSLEPQVIGYAGPYRLGMIGYQNPKWAVFADEHHMRSELDTLERKKRRSVEVNRFKDGRRSYFDPVAALGPESPRLPLPVARYSADEDPAKERYSFASPSVVSGGNTYIPRAEPMKERHSTEPQNVEMNPSTSDQNSLIRNLIAALMETPEFQFVRSQMQAGQGGQPQPQPQQPMNPQQGDQGAGQPTGGAPGGFGAGGGTGDDDEMNRNRYHVQDDNDAIVERFSLLQEEHATLTDQYSQLAAANAQNMQEMGQMRKALVQLEQRAVDSDRTVRIKDLYQQYPHFVDVDQEMETCLYSHGSDMGSEAFDKHIEQLERYAQRSSPTTRMVPGGESPAGAEKYSGDFHDRVVERYTEMANSGKVLSYAEVEAMVKRGE